MTSDELKKMVQLLLDALYEMVPVGPVFRTALTPLMHFTNAENKQDLLNPPNYALFAWFILSGIVIGTVMDEQGNERVVRIYGKEDIFTDLRSFLDGKPSTMRLIVIDQSSLLYIRRSDYKGKMEAFEESHKLVRFIQFKEQALESHRALLMSLNDEDKFKEFAKNPLMNQVPNTIGASFLKMTPQNYCRLKALYNTGEMDL